MSMEGKPPGWYPDPDRMQPHESWWDGSKWTGATRQPPNDEPKKKGGCLKGLLIFLGIAFVMIVLFFIFSGDGSSTSTTVSSAEFYEWSQEVGSTDDSVVVTLKGEKPEGYPTEIWVDDTMLDRDEGGSFAWATDRTPAVPTPVSIIDDLETCEEVLSEGEFWLRIADDATTLHGEFQALAYANYAGDVARGLCT